MGGANVYPRVTVIVLNWNNVGDTLTCLHSLHESDYPADRLSVIVVDNGSADDSTTRIRRAYPAIIVLETGINLGYTGGNNVGIRHAISRGTDYLWILNDDITVAPDALSVLVRAAVETRGVAVCGPKIYMRETPNAILSVGCVMRNKWQLVHKGLGETDYGQHDETEDVEYLSGSSLFLSVETIQSVGPFDEEFFAYYEDIEWCHRVRKTGQRILCVPQAKVWHPDPRGRDAVSGVVTYYTSRNQLLFLKKARLGRMALASAMIQYLIWLGNWSLNPKWRHFRRKRDALFLALIDFLRGKTGQCDWQL